MCVVPQHLPPGSVPPAPRKHKSNTPGRVSPDGVSPASVDYPSYCPAVFNTSPYIYTRSQYCRYDFYHLYAYNGSGQNVGDAGLYVVTYINSLPYKGQAWVQAVNLSLDTYSSGYFRNGNYIDDRVTASSPSCFVDSSNPPDHVQLGVRRSVRRAGI